MKGNIGKPFKNPWTPTEPHPRDAASLAAMTERAVKAEASLASAAKFCHRVAADHKSRGEDAAWREWFRLGNRLERELRK